MSKTFKRGRHHAAPHETAPDTERLIARLWFEPVLSFQYRCAKNDAVEVRSRSHAPLYVFCDDGWRVRMADGVHLANKGDILFLPRGGVHLVFRDEQVVPRGIEDLVRAGFRNRHGVYAVGSEHDALVAGSFFETSALMEHPLMALLPEVVHCKAGEGAGDARVVDWVRWISDLDAGNAMAMGPSINGILRMLLSRHFADPAHAVGLEAAPGRRDRQLSTAVLAMHEHPARNWTVDALAALCHLSRSAFASRFSQQFGLPPLRYLFHTRMRIAARLLKEQRLTLDQVAQQVGYSNGLALSRSFKRATGMRPRGQAQP
jgi:AraC-like DNA-binding protein